MTKKTKIVLIILLIMLFFIGFIPIWAFFIEPNLLISRKIEIKDPALKQLVITNTVPLTPEKQLDKIKVLDIAPLFGKEILKIHQGEAIGELFEDHKMEF